MPEGGHSVVIPASEPAYDEVYGSFPVPLLNERLYSVLSPMLVWEDRIDEYGGPLEEYHDCVYVTARNRREAKVRALKLFREGKGEQGIHRNRWWEEGNPFAGMKAELIEPCPIHAFRFEECLCGAPADEATK